MTACVVWVSSFGEAGTSFDDSFLSMGTGSPAANAGTAVPPGEYPNTNITNSRKQENRPLVNLRPISRFIRGSNIFVKNNNALSGREALKKVGVDHLRLIQKLQTARFSKGARV